MPRGLRIGLTGGIASGKTLVAKRFAELGVPIADADEIARHVVEPGQPALAQIVEAFGKSVLQAHDGRLDRRALRDIVFADAQKRKSLEAILHPIIRAGMDRRAAEALSHPRTPYVVMVIPLLVEAGALDRVDRILVVDVAEATQLDRVMARDTCSLEQARAVLAAQASRAQRLAAAHDVLENDGSVAELVRAVDLLHERYLSLAADSTP